MAQTKWFERKFDFNFDENILPEIIERLQATTGQLDILVKALPREILELRIDNTWSVKENIGHMSDLEPLWQGRLEDILLGKAFLRPTDLQNKKTDLAGHNEKELTELLNQFVELRKETVDRLTGLKETEVYKSALHPRLKTPMRVMDLFLFVAEHDDHHLARVQEIINISSSSASSVF